MNQSTKQLNAKGLVTDIMGVVRQKEIEFPMDIETMEFFMLTVYGEDVSDDLEEAVKHSEFLELTVTDFRDVNDVDHAIDFKRDEESKWNRRIVPRPELCEKCGRVVPHGEWFYYRNDEEMWCEACMKKEAMVDNLESFIK